LIVVPERIALLSGEGEQFSLSGLLLCVELHGLSR
jgi:hypothetical protein